MKTIRIKAKQAIKAGKVQLVDFWGSIAWRAPQKAKLKRDGLICITIKPLLKWVFFNKKSGQTNITADVTLSQLRRLVKKAEKKKAYWAKVNKKKKRRYHVKKSFVHLNPELSFFVDYTK
jgi:hypothetical protein